MESMLLKQAAALRDLRTADSKPLLFSYVMFSASQIWYKAQQRFNEARYSALWSRLDNGTAFTCCAGGACPCWHDCTEAVYDFCQAATRDFFRSEVIEPFLASDDLDGIFFDEVDALAHQFAPSLLNSSTAARFQQCSQDFMVELIAFVVSRGSFPRGCSS